jgi:ATP-dependent DNA ligase
MQATANYITPATFVGDPFIFSKWYQGCGTNITGPDDEALLAEYEASGKWVVEKKCDGIFCTAFVLPKRTRFLSKNCKEKAYGLSSWKDPNLNAGTLLVGELGYGSEHAVERRERYGHDFMDVHDILFLDYQDLTQVGDDDRRKILEDWWSKLDPKTQARFRIVPRWYDNFVMRYKMEHEGLVLKMKGNRPYTGNKRKVRHWGKCKKAFLTDMVILDWTISSADTKKGEPMVESVLCGQHVHGKLEGLVSVGSMEQHLQRDIAQNFQNYKGRVVRLRHYGQFKSGSLRHPSFDPENTFPNTPATSCVFK